MSSDLWGPVSPPRWMSNYETSILNQQMGREAAASFNQAWNSSFGREQSGKIQKQENEQVAGLQAKAEARRSQQKLADEERERTRIAGEDALRQSSINDSIARRRASEFHEKLTPFIESLNPENQPPSTSPYGSPGSPSRSISPWLVTPLERSTSTSPNESLWGGGIFSGGQSSPITGESGPFDPTYEDYQRAKSEHPALWLDPVTAPTMQKMDQSWNEMEKTRMMAEKDKDEHQKFQAKQEADQLALDVGKQGMTRFGLRENAYLKAPSEIQMRIDAMPNRGRYPDDSSISKSLRFSPLTAAAENELNQYLAAQNQLRIDGANKEEIDQRKIDAIRAAHPGGKEKITLGPKGTSVSIESPKPGEDPDVEPRTKEIGGVTVAWMPGSKGLHIIRGDKSVELTTAQALKLAEGSKGEDAKFFREYAVTKGRELTKGFKASEKKPEAEGFWSKVSKFFGGEPTPTAPATEEAASQPSQPEGAVSKDFWSKPAPGDSPEKSTSTPILFRDGSGKKFQYKGSASDPKSDRDPKNWELVP